VLCARFGGVYVCICARARACVRVCAPRARTCVCVGVVVVVVVVVGFVRDGSGGGACYGAAVCAGDREGTDVAPLVRSKVPRGDTAGDRGVLQVLEPPGEPEAEEGVG